MLSKPVICAVLELSDNSAHSSEKQVRMKAAAPQMCHTDLFFKLQGSKRFIHLPEKIVLIYEWFGSRNQFRSTPFPNMKLGQYSREPKSFKNLWRLKVA